MNNWVRDYIVRGYWVPVDQPNFLKSIMRRRKICKIFDKDYRKSYTVPVGNLSSKKASKLIKDLIDSYK